MKNKIVIIILMMMLLTSLFRTDLSAEVLVKYDVDFSLSNIGVVKVLLNTGSNVKSKLIVQSGEVKYTYNIADGTDYVNFPLQLGNGNYVIKIYENTTGTKYKNVYAESADVVINPELGVYLISNQQINWSKTDDAIIFAQKMIDAALAAKVKKTKDAKATLTESEKIDVLYSYVVKNITYDYNKIKTLEYNYVPDIDLIIKAKSGICFDYSAVLAAMLRSQGIPAKLIKGYSTTTSVYHAWNEIYLSTEKRWVIVDTTYDAYMFGHQKKYTMEKSISQYTMELQF
ncbi:MAG: transglutaminase domain-containing protein [Vallitaleaceae bacterium]|nr:transglutaminase domain-containing protein [Vallitaleaceae bacterium]